MNPFGSRSLWLVVLTAACWSNVATGQTGNTSPATAELATTVNRFGFALLPGLEEQGRDANLFYSPLSMMLALSMAYNGAGGRTQQAMSRTLGLGRMSLQTLNLASATLLDQLTRQEYGLELNIANSLWARQGMTFRPEFLASNQQFYGADLSVLNFGDPASVVTINDWVAKRTKGKIPTIVKELEPGDALVLINAVYFKAAWTSPFDPSRTTDAIFYSPTGATQAPMMNTKQYLRCYSGDGVTAAVLPYGRLTAQMELFLPDAGVPTSEFVKKFDYDTYVRWKQLFSSTLTTLSLPRVKLAYSTDLKLPLGKLGMGAAFASTADFSGMTSDARLFISKVGHKATLEIDEKGTEAAAVTSLIGGGSSGPPPRPPCTLTTNRPFAVVITDRRTDVVLFMGVVTNPQPGGV